MQSGRGSAVVAERGMTRKRFVKIVGIRARI